MLIEVLVSAMLVSLIAVGTFVGFASSGSATANERANAQANVIAQQDEERLRGMTVTKLAQLGESAEPQYVAQNGLCVEELSNAWSYCTGTSYAGQKYTGTVFTVISSAKFVTATASEEETPTCETSGGNADYIKTTSSVTWPSIGTHSPVTQSSLVAVPTGKSLLVKVINQSEEAVAGATVELTATGAKQITPASGCVIFGGIPETEKTVKVSASKYGWVEVNGKSPATATVVPTAGTTLTHTFQIGQAGAIDAEFESNGAKGAYGDTFVAVQTGMATPQFVLEGTVSPSATSASSDYLTTVSSPTSLFPFVKHSPAGNNPYTVYAGDCTENDPAKQGLTDATAQVNPGGLAKPTLVVPPVKITVYTGTTVNASQILKSGTASITDEACQKLGDVPVNYSTKPSYVHYQPLNSEGHLTYPGQPFGKFVLCVTNGTNKRWKGEFTNNSTAGSEPGNDSTSGGYGIILLGSSLGTSSSGTC
jgi:hypothetical protein